MDDFSDELMPDKSVSPKMRGLLNKEKVETKQRVIERGIVHFRADFSFMEALLSAAEGRKVAPGTLCRSIVWNYLQTLNEQKKELLQSTHVSEPYRTWDELTVPVTSPANDLAKLAADVREIKLLLLGKEILPVPPKLQRKRTKR
jgi:hypothetical protein